MIRLCTSDGGDDEVLLVRVDEDRMVHLFVKCLVEERVQGVRNGVCLLLRDAGDFVALRGFDREYCEVPQGGYCVANLGSQDPQPPAWLFTRVSVRNLGGR